MRKREFSVMGIAAQRDQRRSPPGSPLLGGSSHGSSMARMGTVSMAAEKKYAFF
jgi:hypothetical protein